MKAGPRVGAAVAGEAGAQEAQDGSRRAAGFVADLAASAHGPAGGLKLVDHGDGKASLLRSAAAVLSLGGLRSPDLAPYASLARRQAAAGADAELAVLLAARLVQSSHRGLEAGAGRAGLLEGLRLAARQGAAVLASLALPDPQAACLRMRWPETGPLAWQAVQELQRGTGVALDDVEVVAGEPPTRWLPGIPLDPDPAPRVGDVRLVLLDRPIAKPRRDVTLRAAAPAALAALRRHESASHAAVAGHLSRLGVGLLAGAGAVPEPLADALHARGIATCPDVPAPKLRRLARATGAVPAATPSAAAAQDVGLGAWLRHGRRWLLAGRRPSATLLVAGQVAPGLAVEEGEAALRAAGLHASDPRAVPGGGRWCRAVAASLRRAAPAAPGHAPLGLQAAADAVASLADDAVRNAGGDPWREPLLQDRPESLSAVRLAVAAAFELAGAQLRIDARWAKRPSSPAALRGGGSPTRIRSGDVPPLM